MLQLLEFSAFRNILQIAVCSETFGNKQSRVHLFVICFHECWQKSMYLHRQSYWVWVENQRSSWKGSNAMTASYFSLFIKLCWGMLRSLVSFGSYWELITDFFLLMQLAYYLSLVSCEPSCETFLAERKKATYWFHFVYIMMHLKMSQVWGQ